MAISVLMVIRDRETFEASRHLLVELILQASCLICLPLQFIDFPRQVRYQTSMLVEFTLGHGKIIFALLAIILRVYELEGRRQGRQTHSSPRSRSISALNMVSPRLSTLRFSASRCA